MVSIPVPDNKLVAFTLAGALLTAVVAGGLATSGGGLVQTDEQADSPGTPASQRVADDAPTPNQDFTPAVQTQSGYEDEEREDREEEREDGEHEEDE
ncbi:hypothetical protein [Halorussus marinus]|uniref:hypothetical protein n=1 Tax=Halorussus marinus TaxID=2505976 RepID=UPI001FD695F1|nr:hypothetical protein [Halorussus marinus]